MTTTELIYSFQESPRQYFFLQRINKTINEIKIEDVRIATKQTDSKTFLFVVENEKFG